MHRGISYRTFSAILISSDNANLEITPKDCLGKESVEDFRNCINEIDLTFVNTVNIESFIQEQHINYWGVNQIIIPSDGSIQNKGITQTNTGKVIPPTLTLNSTYEYNLYLFDRDSFLPLRNPAIIERSFIRIRANSSIVIVYLKVSSQ